MLPILRIEPCKGLSKLKFGCSTEDAKKYFGEPEDIDVMDDLEDAKSTVWHYWDQGFSLFFDHNNNNEFCCVEIDNTTALLWDIEIFQLDENEIIALFKTHSFDLFETEMHEWGEKRLSFDDANIDFYFNKGKLVSVNFGKPPLSNNILILPN